MTTMNIIENISLTAWLLAVVSCYLANESRGCRRLFLAACAVPLTVVLIARIWA